MVDITDVPCGERLQFAIENGPAEIVNFPINSMVIFHSYVSLPEGQEKC